MPPVRPRATTRDIRQANVLAIVRSVYALRTPTRQGIAARTGLSFATVAAVVNELLTTGLLVEAGKETSAGGRPRSRLRIAADFGTLVGVDVAESFLGVTVYDAALSPLGHLQRDVDGSGEPAHLLGQIADAVRDGLTAALPEAAAGGPQQPNLGVGISLPGQVRAKTGVSVFAPSWGWCDVPVQRLLSGLLPHPVYLDNPMKASTMAELWFGRGRETGDLVTVILGTGVGAGIAIDGRLIRGTVNNAGEWGHTTLVMNGRECRCGRSGCVEAYVGVPGLMDGFVAEFGPAHHYLQTGGQTGFIRSVRAGMIAGEPEAQWLVNRFAELLGQALANLVNVINPSVVVLNSWVSDQLGEWLAPPSERIMIEQSISSSTEGLRLVHSGLDAPVALGMATLALEQYLADPRLDPVIVAAPLAASS